jgi:hypothetical protein
LSIWLLLVVVGVVTIWAEAAVQEGLELELV